jgi:hypothetical protein
MYMPLYCMYLSSLKLPYGFLSYVSLYVSTSDPIYSVHFFNILMKKLILLLMHILLIIIDIITIIIIIKYAAS